MQFAAEADLTGLWKNLGGSRFPLLDLQPGWIVLH